MTFTRCVKHETLSVCYSQVSNSCQCPVGSWPKNPRLKEIGRVGKVTLCDAIEPYTLALWTRVLGYSSQEAQEWVDQVRAELLNTSLHTHVMFHYVYAQRPVDG